MEAGEACGEASGGGAAGRQPSAAEVDAELARADEEAAQYGRAELIDLDAEAGPDGGRDVVRPAPAPSGQSDRDRDAAAAARAADNVEAARQILDLVDEDDEDDPPPSVSSNASMPLTFISREL